VPTAKFTTALYLQSQTSHRYIHIPLPFPSSSQVSGRKTLIQSKSSQRTFRGEISPYHISLLFGKVGRRSDLISSVCGGWEMRCINSARQVWGITLTHITWCFSLFDPSQAINVTGTRKSRKHKEGFRFPPASAPARASDVYVYHTSSCSRRRERQKE